MDARTQVAVFTIGVGLAPRAAVHAAEKEPLLAAIAAATSGTDLKDRPLTAQSPAGRARRRGGDRPARVAGEPPRPATPPSPPAERLTGAGASARPGVPDGTGWRSARHRRVRSHARCAWPTASSARWRASGRSIPLLALVKAQAALAGRKTLVFFSPGLQVPPNLDDVFRTIVSEANRANVSVYTVDARGLQTPGRHPDSGAALREAATTSMTAADEGRGRRDDRPARCRSWTRPTSSLHPQRAADALRPRRGHRRLPRRERERLRQGRRPRRRRHPRLLRDPRTSPAVVSFDGSFRRIAVKVARKDVVLQSRRGYFALPPCDQICCPTRCRCSRRSRRRRRRTTSRHQAAALHFAAGPGRRRRRPSWSRCRSRRSTSRSTRRRRRSRSGSRRSRW